MECTLSVHTYSYFVCNLGFKRNLWLRVLRWEVHSWLSYCFGKFIMVSTIFKNMYLSRKSVTWKRWVERIITQSSRYERDTCQHHIAMKIISWELSAQPYIVFGVYAVEPSKGYHFSFGMISTNAHKSMGPYSVKRFRINVGHFLKR